MHLFHLRREQGRLAEVESPFATAVREFPWYPMHKAALCCLLAELGRTDEARAVFAELAADDFASIYRDNEWLLGMSLASHACALLGDSNAARRPLRAAATVLGRHAIGHAEGSVGMVDTYLGLLAATLLELRRSRGYLTVRIESLRAWRSSVARHAQHELAEILRRRGKSGDSLFVAPPIFCGTSLITPSANDLSPSGATTIVPGLSVPLFHFNGFRSFVSIFNKAKSYCWSRASLSSAREILCHRTCDKRVCLSADSPSSGSNPPHP